MPLAPFCEFLVRAPRGAPPRSLVLDLVRAMADAEPETGTRARRRSAPRSTCFLDGAPVAAHRESVAERAGRVFRRYQTAIILVLTYLSIRSCSWRCADCKGSRDGG